ncbi:hypothetical protein G7A66_12200 [Altererythrobacter sp. SALINAS58]|uniref:hypothetical protein n=1 Tax=Alteripontixanthobacter muriae TaxID=2705546 RepID=UPI001576087B|nr:hypothetical protein [Alteripontixanthobacter muriae]NTZ43832.1 hypothetical protein [Alteripontixanthobacter muriae]
MKRMERAAIQTLYPNIGTNRGEHLMRAVELLEEAGDREAGKEFLPMQPGEIYKTCADNDAISADLGNRPATSIEHGIPESVRRHRDDQKV